MKKIILFFFIVTIGLFSTIIGYIEESKKWNKALKNSFIKI